MYTQFLSRVTTLFDRDRRDSRSRSISGSRSRSQSRFRGWDTFWPPLPETLLSKSLGLVPVSGQFQGLGLGLGLGLSHILSLGLGPGLDLGAFNFPVSSRSPKKWSRQCLLFDRQGTYFLCPFSETTHKISTKAIHCHRELSPAIGTIIGYLLFLMKSSARSNICFGIFTLL